MFAKSLADLEVRSQLVWQNKGENSLQRAINSKEGGAARPEVSTGPCPRLVPSAEGYLHPLPHALDQQAKGLAYEPHLPGTPACWVI